MVEETSYKDLNEGTVSTFPWISRGDTFKFTKDYLSDVLDIKTLEEFYKGLKQGYVNATLLQHLNGSEIIHTYLGANSLKSGKVIGWRVIYEMDKMTLFKSSLEEGAKHYRKSRRIFDAKDSLAIAAAEKEMNPLTERIEERIEKISAYDFTRFKGGIMRCALGRNSNGNGRISGNINRVRGQYVQGILESLRSSHPCLIRSIEDLTPENLDYIRHN